MTAHASLDPDLLVGWASDHLGLKEPGTLYRVLVLFSPGSSRWESNPKLQGGWCKTQPPTHRGI
jgi:hypothetical protein